MAAIARRQRQSYAKCRPRMQQSADSLEAPGKSDFMNKWARIGPKQRPNRVSRFPAADIGNLGSASAVRRSDSSLLTDRGPQPSRSICRGGQPAAAPAFRV